MTPNSSKKLSLVCVLSVLASLTGGYAQADASGPVCSPEPLYDKGCRISPREREARLEWLEKTLIQPAKDDLLKPALTAYADYTDYVDGMNHAYIASDVLFVASTALLTFVDVAQVAALIKAGNWIKLGAFAVLDGVAVARTVYTNLDFQGKVTASVGKIDLRSREELEALYKMSLQQLVDENEGARIFLSGEPCATGHCPGIVNTRIQTTYEHLSAWHEDATRDYEEPTRLMEWWSHGRGNHVAQYDLPFASNLTVLFGINVTYLETIKQLLIEDGIRCAVSSPSTRAP
jgi:hypothetical protein